MTPDFQATTAQLIRHLEKQSFKGYDPYDAMNIPLPWGKMGKWLPAIAIQFIKRCPINFRPLLFARNHNPKAMGLFLYAFCLLFEKTRQEKYRDLSDYFFNWLLNNTSKGYRGKSWGYNFQWISPVRNLPAFAPSAVVTAFVCRGLYAYYRINQSEKAKLLLIDAAEFVMHELPLVKDTSGISFSYTPLQKEVCYNASLLAAEILYYADSLSANPRFTVEISEAVNFVLARQHSSGAWDYSESLDGLKKRKQVDFHQAYILESLFILKDCNGVDKPSCEKAIKIGLEFYRLHQFYESGQAKFRLPKIYPTDIHHLSHGIITFSKLSSYDPSYSEFSQKIAIWTINHFFSKKHYFYYRKYRLYTNKIDYTRWAQAWMLMALSEVYINAK